ncbi:hypothetical protein HWV07_05165 [Natronomonas salina]|uniref:hypothetical protein n=1 Tax=Natronomonas salina TaxID=1710540 RepID=UPI0015B52523|nr:hypothetical protein [Natronomonas salina]QLD88454.1 hypothetical protein HWV07_05165 [Natronomonas salina]
MDRNEESGSPDGRRRTLLKTIVAAGAIGGGGFATTGAAAAKGNGSNVNRLVFEDEWSGTLAEETDVVDNNAFETGEEATFDGKLVIDELDVNEAGELVAAGRLQGRLTQNPTQQINQAFETVLGLLEDVLGLLSPNSSGECPILELVIQPIFLDLLGLQIETETIAIDITAVAGPGNLLGNLLCAVAGLLDP